MSTITLNKFIAIWNSLEPGLNAYKRIDIEHPLDFYIGKNNSNNKELLLISNYEPIGLTGSKSIEVHIGKRQDERWSITFTLIKMEHEHLFLNLCYHLIESSRYKTNNGISFVIKLFKQWQQMLAHSGDGILPIEAQKGLFGEMLFFKDCINKGFNLSQTTDAWIGCNKADRDFVFESKWYEIKTIDPAAYAVKISSIEQLDTPEDGVLVVNFVEKTTLQDNKGLTLNELIEEIRNLLKSEQSTLSEFNTKLVLFGFLDNKKYNEIKYFCKYVKHYSVNSSFPRIVRQSLPTPITKLSYELCINALSEWEIK